MRRWLSKIPFILLLCSFCVLAGSIAFPQGNGGSPEGHLRGLRAQTMEEVLALPEEEIDLATAALLLAQEAWRDLYGKTIDVQAYQERLDAMAKTLKERIGKRKDPEKVISIINKYLFEELGFQGIASPDGSNPREFSLNFVLDMKGGNCLGLSILYLSLGERLGLPLYGVVVPEHFFVRYSSGRKEFNIETTAQGVAFSNDYYVNTQRVPRGNPLYLKNLKKREVIGLLYNATGSLYLARGSLRRAIACLNRAIAINPDDAGAYYNRGLAYHDLGSYTEAIADYSRSIDLNPQNAEAYRFRGGAYLARGLYDQAIDDYSQALKIRPEFPEAYLGRSTAYLVKGLYDRAVADATRALELNPRLVEAYDLRGNAYQKMKRYDEAIADYSSAIALDPQYAAAYNKRGFVYLAKDRLAQAIGDFERALKINPQYAEAYYYRGTAYFALGLYDNAISDYSRAIEINPGYAEAYLLRGTVYIVMSRTEEGFADYAKTCELDPVLAYFVGGLLFDYFEFSQEALACYQRFTEYASGKYAYDDFMETARARIRGLRGKVRESKK